MSAISAADVTYEVTSTFVVLFATSGESAVSLMDIDPFLTDPTSRVRNMAQAPNEDLFESTKMPFGEHLEELRVCLVRSLMGLGIGFLLGLLVAGPWRRRHGSS